jgi:hypothetical protein
MRSCYREGARHAANLSGEHTAKMLRFLAVPLRSCLVSLTDSRGVQHSVEVTAETLFEAAALGVALLRKHGWVDQGFALGTKLQVDVREPAPRHTVTLSQVERWLDGATCSPNERVRKDRLRELLRSK